MKILHKLLCSKPAIQLETFFKGEKPEILRARSFPSSSPHRSVGKLAAHFAWGNLWPVDRSRDRESNGEELSRTSHLHCLPRAHTGATNGPDRHTQPLTSALYFPRGKPHEAANRKVYQDCQWRNFTMRNPQMLKEKCFLILRRWFLGSKVAWRLFWSSKYMKDGLSDL